MKRSGSRIGLKKMELPSSQPEICSRTSTILMDFLGDVVKRSDPESNPFFKNWFPLWLTGDELFPRRQGPKESIQIEK